MHSGPDDQLTLIRRYYSAYERDDRPAIDALLHPEFTFTSPAPEDDRSDRATYLERCWPGHESITSVTLLDVCADADGALARYRAAQPNGPGFTNVERFEFAGDCISHVEVYFGRDLTRRS